MKYTNMQSYFRLHFAFSSYVQKQILLEKLSLLKYRSFNFTLPMAFFEANNNVILQLDSHMRTIL